MSIKTLTKSDDFQDEKLPKYVESKEYGRLIEYLCQFPDQRIQNITEFCEELVISRDTFYRWIKHPHTKSLVREYIDGLATQDQTKMYQNITNMSEHNPRAAKLWHEIYQAWQGPGDKSGTKFIINVAVFSGKKGEQIQEIEED
jgi:hypothetical protein